MTNATVNTCSYEGLECWWFCESCWYWIAFRLLLLIFPFRFLDLLVSVYAQSGRFHKNNNASTYALV